MIELKYKKNEKFEIEFENLDEIKEGCNDVLLKIENGDIMPIACFIDKAREKNKWKINLFIPNLTNYHINLLEIAGCCYGVIERFSDNIAFYTFDIDNLYGVKNIIPDWSKYIDEDSAVLFLSEEDCDKYNKNDNYDTYFIYPNGLSPREVNSEMDIRDWSKISIIVPELTSKNIQEINNIAKELKEKYGVEKVEVFASHCFTEIETGNKFEYDGWHGKSTVYINFCPAIGYGKPSEESYLMSCFDNGFAARVYKYIDKLTTTNSTGILDACDEERLKVIDVVEFFD